MLCGLDVFCVIFLKSHWAVSSLLACLIYTLGTMFRMYVDTILSNECLLEPVFPHVSSTHWANLSRGLSWLTSRLLHLHSSAQFYAHLDCKTLFFFLQHRLVLPPSLSNHRNATNHSQSPPTRRRTLTVICLPFPPKHPTKRPRHGRTNAG